MARRKITAVKSNGALESRSVGELVELHQSLVTGKPPTFKTKQALVRACIVALSKQQTPKSLARTILEPKNRKPIRWDPTMLENKAPGREAKRTELIADMRKGISFAQIQRKFEWTYKQAYCHVHAVNKQYGYGVFERDKILTAYTYDEGPPT